MQKNNQVDVFALQIATAWQKAVSSIIETGQLLIKAKEELKHGQGAGCQRRI